MRRAIVGSRDYPYRSDVFAFVRGLWVNPVYKVTSIVTGGAAGVDTFAELAAIQCGIPVTVHKPDWRRYGRGAGFIRNQLIVDDADILYAFMTNPDKGSNGTKDSVSRARRKGIPTMVYCACHSKWHNVSTEPLKHTLVGLREGPSGLVMTST